MASQQLLRSPPRAARPSSFSSSPSTTRPPSLFRRPRVPSSRTARVVDNDRGIVNCARSIWTRSNGLFTSEVLSPPTRAHGVAHVTDHIPSVSLFSSSPDTSIRLFRRPADSLKLMQEKFARLAQECRDSHPLTSSVRVVSTEEDWEQTALHEHNFRSPVLVEDSEIISRSLEHLQQDSDNPAVSTPRNTYPEHEFLKDLVLSQGPVNHRARALEPLTQELSSINVLDSASQTLIQDWGSFGDWLQFWSSRKGGGGPEGPPLISRQPSLDGPMSLHALEISGTVIGAEIQRRCAPIRYAQSMDLTQRCWPPECLRPVVLSPIQDPRDTQHRPRQRPVSAPRSSIRSPTPEPINSAPTPMSKLGSRTRDRNSSQGTGLRYPQTGLFLDMATPGSYWEFHMNWAGACAWSMVLEGEVQYFLVEGSDYSMHRYCLCVCVWKVLTRSLAFLAPGQFSRRSPIFVVWYEQKKNEQQV